MSEFSVPIEEAMARLVVQPDYDSGAGPEPSVHTFRSTGFVLLGAHWSLESVREAMEKHGVEEAGEQASAMGHRLVVIDERGPLFIEAGKPADARDAERAMAEDEARQADASSTKPGRRMA